MKIFEWLDGLTKSKTNPVKVEKPKIKLPLETIELSLYADKDNLLEKIVKQGIKNDEIIPYDGMTTSDIKELDERVYEVNDTADIRNELVNNEVKFYITDYENKEYYLTSVPLNKKWKFYFENKDKLRINEDYYFRGGKYKQVYDGKIETDDTPVYIWVDISMYDKEG